MCRSLVNNITTESSAPTLTQSPPPLNDGYDNDDGFAFSIQVNKIGSNKLQRTKIMVGGIQTEFIIDSGADCNVMSKQSWETLKANQVNVNRSVRGGPGIYSYSSKAPLEVIGQFWADIQKENGEGCKNVQFIVIDGVAESLLGIESAVELGLINFSNNAVVHSGVASYMDLDSKYPKLFSGKIGKAENIIKLSIDDTVPPVAQPFRRIPFALRCKLESHLTELIEADIIEKVSGPVTWASPVVIVPKPDASIRLCVDMRQANQAIKRHNFPVPTVDELLLDMNGSAFFSKIDLKSGFHQFLLSEDSRDITTFNTHVGLYRYKRLMFGISSAPEIYQSMVSKIISGIPGVANLADDIVVHGRTRDEHDARLTAALRCLEDAGMTLNRKKCVFGADQINFVGHRLSAKGIDPGADKVKAITEACEPKTVSEMKSFLGLVGYCSKFIPDFSSKTYCLREMTLDAKPADQISLDDNQREAFECLKRSLADKNTLAYFDVNAETSMYTDASPVGISLVLTQRQNDINRVIYYASRSLTPVERRYCQTEKEALAIVWACERMHHYLLGTTFTLITDHKALEAIYGNRKKKCSARIERWVLRLQGYDFQVKYIKGSLNIADSLSRLVKADSNAQGTVMGAGIEDVELFVRSVVLSALVDLEAITAADVERASDSDPELSCIREAIRTENFSDVPRAYKAVSQELCCFGRLVLRGNRVIVPAALRTKLVAIGHEGHMGIVGTKRNLRARVWWPGIDTDVERFVRQCHGCQIVTDASSKDPIRVTDLPNGPWEDLAVDLLGPLPNGENILVAVDYYSRWYEIRFLTSTKAEKVIKVLQNIFETHGLPKSIKTDNGPQFVAGEFKDCLKSLGIHHHLVTPRWPAANGEVERQNRSIMKRIRIAHAEGKDYKTELKRYLVSYRNSPHSITGKSPAEMLFGRKLRGKLPQLSSVYDDIETRDLDHEKNTDLLRKLTSSAIAISSR